MNKLASVVLWLLIAIVGAFSFAALALGRGETVNAVWLVSASVRREGKWLGEMIKVELGPVPGSLALVGVLAIMIIILAVLSLVVVKALTASPWGLFTIAATIPIALLMGVYMRIIRPGRVGEASIIGVVLLLASLYYGRAVAESAALAPLFTLT